MHINENSQSNNGWQNIGICHKFAIDKIKTNYIAIYLRIVEYSFGYCQTKTNEKTIKWWCKNLSISDKTFSKAIRWLEENKYIKVITYKSYIKGGGSKPNIYAPAFPYKINKKYGHIKIDKEDISSGSKKNKDEETLREGEENW